jgi:hypothetical protein
MKRILCISAIGVAALVSACASPAATTQTAAANVGPDGEPLVCRKMLVTGTRFPQKECKTAEAWEQYDAYTNGNAKESTDGFQRLNTGSSTQAGT